MFGSVVLGIPDEAFEEPLAEYKAKKGYKVDTDLTAEDWKAMTETFKAVVKKTRASISRRIRSSSCAWRPKPCSSPGTASAPSIIATRPASPDDLGTAVNIVTMVFGNMGKDSGTGVAFTRNPSTGERKMYGDYLLNAQGEDVVAGIRNTEKIENMGKELPEAYKQFLEITDKLEKHYNDMQDVEFTIERGKLWMLQTRNGKRTAKAAVKIAVDMANEGLITKEEADPARHPRAGGYPAAPAVR